MSTVGTVTIGQSPRPDVIEPMRSVWGKYVEVRQLGALDGLAADEIGRLKPEPAEKALVTRLRDGSVVKLSQRRIKGLMQKRVDELASQGCGIVVVLCTADFNLSADVDVLHPRDALDCVVGAAAFAESELQLGVVVPDESQIRDLGDFWVGQGYRSPAVRAHSPYRFDDHESLERVMRVYQKRTVDLVVLDCMGYTPSHALAVQRRLRIPVVCAQAAAAQFTRLLLAMRENVQDTVN